MILKSACSNNPSYIDRLISVFMRSLQKMVREHLNPQAASGSTEATAGDNLRPGFSSVIEYLNASGCVVKF